MGAAAAKCAAVLLKLAVPTFLWSKMCRDFKRIWADGGGVAVVNGSDAACRRDRAERRFWLVTPSILVLQLHHLQLSKQ